MKKAFLVGLFAIGYLLLAMPVKADSVCQPLYGGGESCQTSNLVIDKTVLNPGTNVFVDNLGVNDPKYSPGDQVTFRIMVANTGGATAKNVSVKDVFPQLITFAAGPGTYDNNNKTLTIGLGDLNPTESRTITVSAKVASANELPSDASIVCVVNQAILVNQNIQDNAQVCIQKPGLGIVPAATKGGLKVFPPAKVIATPPTGPEAIALFGLIPTGTLGLLLRKFSTRS